MRSKPVLLIPVCKGGAFFREMLHSISSVSDLFELIVISFNGDGGSDEALLRSSCVNEFSNLRVLRTRKLLSPTQHLFFYVGKLRKLTRSDASIFLLAHDDLLIEANVRSFLSRVNVSGCCVFGDWSVFSSEQPDKCEVKTALLAKNNEMCVGEWLDSIERCARDSLFTNMSGIIVSLRVLSELRWFYKIPIESAGAHFEYCMATSRHNYRLLRAPAPLVNIREHPNQAGRRVTISQFMADEIRFRLWLFLNLKGNAFRKRIIHGPHNLCKSLFYPVKYVKYKVRLKMGLKTKYGN